MIHRAIKPLPIIFKIILAASALTAVLTTFLFNGNTITFAQSAVLVMICAIGVVGSIVALIQMDGEL